MMYWSIFLFLSLTSPSMAQVPPLATPSSCRDFSTASDLTLRLCDYVSVDKLKTDVLALLITEQKVIESDLFLAEGSQRALDRLETLKQFLFLIEQSALQKIEEICSLKGSTISTSSHLVSGCIYNQYDLIKNSLLNIPSNNKQVVPLAPWFNENEHINFDNFINDVLLDLAENSKNDSVVSAQKKALMAEVLKIYESDGQALYDAFQGICGLRMFSESPEDLLDVQIALTCEKAYLDDLSAILFKTIE